MTRNQQIGLGVTVALVAALLTISLSNRFASPPRPKGTDAVRQSYAAVVHVVVPCAKSFDEVVAALEANTPQADVPAFDLPGAVNTPGEAKQRPDGAADKDELQIVGRSDLGEHQARTSGKTVRARLYLIGNRVAAARLLEHDSGAALYLPLRLLVYEDGQGKTRLAYDRISTVFVAYRNERLVTAARLLDEQMEDLVNKTAK